MRNARKATMLLTTITLALLCVLPTQVHASVGVGTNMPFINMPDTLLVGGIYELPRFAIINTGTELTGYEMVIGKIEGKKAPELSWFNFTPAAFTISPRRGAYVDTTIKIPKNAAVGAYEVRVGGRTKPHDLTEGAVVGVAAGPILKFKVAQPTMVQRAVMLFNQWMPWSALALAFLVAMIGFVVWFYIFRLKDKREREIMAQIDEPVTNDEMDDEG